MVLPWRSYTSNRVLASLCEKARLLELKLQEGHSDCEGQGESVHQVCEEHGEKDLLKIALESVEKEKKSKNGLKQQQERTISELDELTRSLEHNISVQFAKIHQFVENKEQHLIEQLRRQKKEDLQRMEKNMKRFDEDLASFEKKISNISAATKHQDNLSFLKEVKRLREKYLVKKDKVKSAQRHEGEEEGSEIQDCKGDEPEGSECSKESLAFSRRKYKRFRGLLQYRVWKQMKQIISPVPALLTLNPKTAHPKLTLSKDRTSVRFGSSEFIFFDYEERFDRVPCVLGSQGFTSGEHYWEVEVGKKADWGLGVATESANRKGRLTLCPEGGYWVLWLTNGNQYEVTESSQIPLTLIVKPSTIRVYLDYEGGQVTFYNADSMSILYTFIDTFTEKLFPFFSPGSYNKDNNCARLKLAKFWTIHS
ncbi:hypothetical protein chiPu_0019564 [Chiloscyllium punctatum]|uniref:B30.2/SPRY domain-containing protein n=1 Tax=Chiloscyllium punctatum TaxID=137246 RepID=A0A401RSI6_CHIPU|nr:hypothetical protein [Chiloscyllium punctatum]